MEKRVQISSPTKGIISPSLISVLVCELCWFCRVKARNNERERRAWRPTASRLFILYYSSVEENNFNPCSNSTRLNHIRNIRIFLLNLRHLQRNLHLSSPVDDAYSYFTSTNVTCSTTAFFYSSFLSILRRVHFLLRCTRSIERNSHFTSTSDGIRRRKGMISH